MDSATRCIECGGLVDSLNEDEDGSPCPACADRLLETLPGVFHRPWMEPWPPVGDGGAEDDDAFLGEPALDEDDGDRDGAPADRGRAPRRPDPRPDPDRPA